MSDKYTALAVYIFIFLLIYPVLSHAAKKRPGDISSEWYVYTNPN